VEVICLQDDAFYDLIEQVVQRIKDKNGVQKDKWVSAEEAMRLLRITSKTTLQKYRDNGSIRFSQPEKKHIVYDVASIDAFLEKHSKDTF
jgi:Helix-turn-helix domain